MSCPYEDEEARWFWERACNFHRGVDLEHVCRNPGACQRRLDDARGIAVRRYL